MSQEQIDVNKVVQSFKEKGYTKYAIIDFLACIIKEQMQYGGTLHEKLIFWNEKIKSIDLIDKSRKSE
jgi:hypothetical protein